MKKVMKIAIGRTIFHGSLPSIRMKPTTKIGTVGCAVQAQPVVIDGLSVGTVAMPKSTGVSRDNSSTASASGRVNQGLLGADVLSTFGKVTVDFKNGKVTLGG